MTAAAPLVRPTAPMRADFRHFVRLPTRWRDNDVYGHMNNAVFYEYADTAVNGWLLAAGGLEVPTGPIVCLVAETGCRFHASLGFPDPVDAGLALVRLGARSLTWRIGLFRGDAASAAADIHFVHVCVTRDDHRSCPVPDALRHAAASLLTAG